MRRASLAAVAIGEAPAGAPTLPTTDATQEDELVSLRQRRAAVAEEGALLDARIAAIELARGAV